MTVSHVLRQPLPFVAMTLVLACLIAAIAAVAVTSMIGGALQGPAPKAQPIVNQAVQPGPAVQPAPVVP